MIYLDYNATTPVLPEIMDSMLPYFTEHWANPSGIYPFSKNPSSAIDTARHQVASLIGAAPEEILFTSGATESNQSILYGASGRILTSTVEHSSIHEFDKNHEQITLVPVNSTGHLDLEHLTCELDKGGVSLVSCIWANNETGVISPIDKVAELCEKHEVPVHSDAVQAAGKVNIDVTSTLVSYLSLSAHKIYGPKGIGALYIRKGSPYYPLLIGSQENARRGGTEPVPLIVGFGKAAQLAKTELEMRMRVTASMRDSLEQSIFREIPGAYLNGNREHRLPNTLNIGFSSVDSDMIIQLMGKQNVMLSNGSACKSQAITPSHVLTAMGRSHEAATEALRFSVSHLTTEAEIDATVSILKEVVTPMQR